MKRIVAALVALAVAGAAISANVFNVLDTVALNFSSASVTGTLSAANGGTGVANNSAATLTRSGNHALTLTTTGTTSVTLPTSGTLVGATTGSTASTFTFNGSGGTSSSVTMQWQKVGNWVTLHIPVVSATTGTGSNTFSSNTALDASVRPTAGVSGVFIALNGGTAQATPGQVIVTTGGLVQMTRDGAGTAFTNSASAGVAGASPFTLTYYVN